VVEVVLVDVVPVAPVALVSVVLVVPVMPVPEVSVDDVPVVAGVELELVVAEVSVIAEPVVSLLVVFSFVSFLQPTANTTSARTQRIARLFFISFLSQSSKVGTSPDRECLCLLRSNRGASEKKTPCTGAQGVER